MRRLIRNIEGERRPLIMHPRLHWLRAIDQNLRLAACKVMGWQYRRPRYTSRTPGQAAEQALACEAFLGAHSPDPRVARYYFEMGRWILLANPNISDDQKQALLSEEPRCSRDDMAYTVSLPVPGRDAAKAEAVSAALDRVLVRARDTAVRLSGEGTVAAFPDPSSLGAG